MSEIENVG